MKKLLLTLLLVAGGFVAQAQNTFHYGLFTGPDGNIYARLVDESVDTPCYANYSDADKYDYEITSANRLVITQNGNQLVNAPATPAVIAQFVPSVNFLLQVRSKTDLGVVRVIPSVQYN